MERIGIYGGLAARVALRFMALLEKGLMRLRLFLVKAESNGRTTIESFRGWSCYASYTENHVCPNWEPTVLRVKAELEAL